MPYSECIGNVFAKEFLEKVAKNSLPFPVLLFSGPEGVGKKTIAKVFIKELVGQKDPHPDVKWLVPEGKQHLHLVSSIKEMIDLAPIAPFEARKKVYVIEEADRMLPASSNALLKILEEPPSHVLFLLLTSHEEEVLPTILSRAVKVPFYPIEEKEIAALLVKEGTSQEEALAAAMNSLGSIGKAKKLLRAEADPVKELFRSSLEKGVTLVHSFEGIDALLDKREDYKEIVLELFADLLFFVRDLHYLKSFGASSGVFHQKSVSSLLKQKEGRIPSLEFVMELLEESKEALIRGSRPRYILEEIFYKLSEACQTSQVCCEG